MNIEEAIKLLNRIDIKNFLTVSIEQSNYIIDEANKVNNAIEIVLNELDKKDKVIDMMAQELINQPIRVMIGNEIFKFTNKEDTLKYFYKKAKEN